MGETQPQPKNYDIDPPSEPPNSPTENPTRETELDEETAKEMAKKLALEEKEIINMVRSQGEGIRRVNGLHIEVSPNQTLIVLNSPEIHNDFSQTTRVELISLTPKVDFAEFTSVETNVRLTAWIQTNENTKKEYASYIKNPTNDLFITNYFFDERGNFGKVEQIPVDFPDPRKPLRATSHVKVLKSNMQPGDFEMANIALSLIKEKLTANTATT